MKKISVSLVVFVLALMTAAPVSAGVYVFNPNPSDIYDLSHNQFYTWGIDWQHQDEEIGEVFLTFKNIRNWRDEPNSLFIHLLDDAPLGLMAYADNDPTITDYFAGQGILVDAWSDVNGGSSGVNLTYSFSDLGLVDEFASYAQDGRFAFAFDPDCHYWNDGVKLTVLTNVPEPATFVLFALGLAGGALSRRKNRE